LNPYLQAWKRIGGRGVAKTLLEKGEFVLAAAELGGFTPSSQKDTENVKIRWACFSLTEDPGHRELNAFGACVGRLGSESRPEGVLIDFPRHFKVEGLEAVAKVNGYGFIKTSVRCTDFGDATARTRGVFLGLRGFTGAEVGKATPDLALRSEAVGILAACRGWSGQKDSLWLDHESETLVLNSRVSTTGDRMLPWPAGHLAPGGGRPRELVHDPRGPAGTFRWPGEGFRGTGAILVIDDRLGVTAVRKLSHEEVWRIQGGDQVLWDHLRGRSYREEDIVKSAVRAMPPKTAAALLSWAERTLQLATKHGETQDKAGMCNDRDEEAAWSTTLRWLQAWKASPGRPSTQFVTEDSARLKEEPSHIAGAVPRSTKAKGQRRARSTPALEFVKPHAIGEARKKISLSTGASTEKGSIKWLDEQAAEAIMSKLSEGTRIGYEQGWTQWMLWRKLQDKKVFLGGETKLERKEDEDDLLRFVMYLARVMNRQDGTIKQKIFAIRYAHLLAGHDDPTLHRSRLWAALNGIKRWQGQVRRKYPVTPRMLLWIKGHLFESGDYEIAEAAVLWFAVMMGFFFLLRASEFLLQSGRSWSCDRVLRGVDVSVRAGNVPTTNFAEAEELVIVITGSKTDQYNEGQIRNQFKSGEPLCPVDAMRLLNQHFPQRVSGSERNLALCRFSNGDPVKREDVQHLMQLAALAAGQDPNRMGSHSLRIGGATALYHATQDLELVKRYGRWLSDAFHGYLWESHEKQTGFSTGMATDFSELTAPS
jgi:hypothetical protein